MKKMDLKRLVTEVEVEEQSENFIVSIPKSQKENMKKLADHFMKKKKRGRLSALVSLIFKEVIKQHKDVL